MFWRLEILILLFLDYGISIPNRIFRFFSCLMGFRKFHGRHKLIRRLAGSFLLLLDITPVPWLMEWLGNVFKRQARRMTREEITMAFDIFGPTVPYHLCTFDPASFFVKKKLATAYTFLHTINFAVSMPSETMIHELVHIWQYHRFGSIYLSEAIWAQRWGGGYNYGGYDALVKNRGAGLSAFNMEQQAEIVEDYFRFKNDIPMQWSTRGPEIENVLEIYILQLKV